MVFKEVSAKKTIDPVEKYVPKINKPIKELPSQGKAYPQKLEIRYRPYTFGEVKTINNSTFSIRDRLLEILSGVTVSHNFDVLNLTLQDVLFIGFLRKRATFVKEDQIIVTERCPKCKKQSDFVLHENQHLEFHDLAAPKLPISFQMHNEKFSFTPITVKLYFDYLDQLVESTANSVDFDESIALMAIQCSSHDFENAYKAVFNASSEEMEMLEEIDKQMLHELKPVKLQCQNKIEDKICGHEHEIKLDEVDRLVLPFRGELQQSVSKKLHFG